MSRNDPQANILPYRDSSGANVGGHYRAGIIVSLSAGQAAGPVYSLRWSSAVKLMVIDYMEMTWIQSAAFTGTQANLITAQVARGFTASDSGGTALTPAGATLGKLLTAMPASAVGDLRFVNSAVALGVGTRTLDVNTFLALEFVNTITNVNPAGAGVKFDVTTGASHPLVLAQNEGLVVSLNGAFPAAGTGTLIVYVEWAEVDAF